MSLIASRLQAGLGAGPAAAPAFYAAAGVRRLLTREEGATGAASVLVPLFLEDGTGRCHVWLTQRAAGLSSHAGEVALPGGKAEGDETVAATALREAEEEVGLAAGNGSPLVIATLPPLLSKHRLKVTPVVAQIRGPFTPKLNPAEVEAAFHLPLSRFLEAEGHTHKDIVMRGAGGGEVPYRMHAFEHRDEASGVDFHIWGMTSAILLEVAKAIFARAPDFDEHPPPGFPAGKM